jgi:hypothetical protein
MIPVIIPWDVSTLDPHREKNFSYVRQWWRESGDFTVITGLSEPFQRSVARNNGFLYATHGVPGLDVVVFADADTLVSLDAVRECVERVRAGEPWGLPFTEYYNRTERDTETVLSQSNANASLETPVEWEHLIMDCVSGVLVVPISAVVHVRGYDHRFQGWGYEDNAFRLSLDKVVGPHFRVKGEAHHLWHPRGEDFNQPLIQFNQHMHQKYLSAKTKVSMQKLIRERPVL